MHLARLTHKVKSLSLFHFRLFFPHSTMFSCVLLLTALAASVTHATHFVKRSDALNAKLASAPRGGAMRATGSIDVDRGVSSFFHQPDYNVREHSISHDEPNELGGR
jgi:hypothetical protein